MTTMIKTVIATTMHRLLLEENNVVEDEDSSLVAAAMMNNTDNNIYNNADSYQYDNNDNDNGEFDPIVFWGVNAFLLGMLLTVCIWCWCLGGKDHVTQWSERRIAADLAYQQALQDRLERQQAAKLDSPTKRTAKLKKSFQRCHVCMVRLASIYVLQVHVLYCVGLYIL